MRESDEEEEKGFKGHTRVERGGRAVFGGKRGDKQGNQMGRGRKEREMRTQKSYRNISSSA